MLGRNMSTAAAALLFHFVRAQIQPLLSTIATLPELSTFSSVINSSGGSQLNPAFEERFNSVLDGRNYTALAPTNDVRQRASGRRVGDGGLTILRHLLNYFRPLVEALTAAPAYPILEAILRTHIAEGLFTSADIVSASPFEAIEGFPISAAAAGDNGTVLVNGQSRIVAVDTIASNGIIHQVDQVLNPFTSYFGMTNATGVPQTTEESEGTVADVVRNDERLSNIRDILQALNPDFVDNRLGLGRADGLPQIFAVPSNDAFSVLPTGDSASAVAPSNQPLSFQLFAFGLINTNAPLAAFDFSAGPVSVANAFTEIGATVTRSDGGAVYLNNAAIQEEVCASNGCVWIIDRVLDPLYLAFGPLDRTN